MRFIGIVCVVAAIACGRAGAERARDVRASLRGGSVEVTWTGAADAVGYTVSLYDLDTQAALGAPVTVRTPHAVLPAPAAANVGVRVDSFPGTRALGFVSGGSEGGSAAQWQIFGPQDYADGDLRVDFPSLDAGERLGVMLINANGDDKAEATVDVSGVEAPAPATAPVSSTALTLAQPLPVSAVHEAVMAAWQPTADVAPAEPIAGALNRSFCVVPGLDFSKRVRKPSTRVLETAHADFYVDDEDLSHYEAPFFDALGQAFEQNVWPADTANFGQPTDVDGNGRILVLLSHELGTHLNGGWLIGYFGNADLLRARDSSADCSGTGSNHGEIVYLNDVKNAGANGFNADNVSSSLYPATLAHEIQHLLNLGHRCVEQACTRLEDTWVNEGMSKLAEDLAGYGWNGVQGRWEGANYMSRRTGQLQGYDGRSLTRWEGDPIGNYQGAHSFLRFFADRIGSGAINAIEFGPGGVEGIEAALGRSLPRAMAEWATALLLSNETDAPYSFSGAAWSPLHQRLRHLQYRAPGETAALRTDGLAAYVSGAGQGGAAQVRVHSSGKTPPIAVVVRVEGTLPEP